MRYPAFLQKNSAIGFAAPSFGCATEPYRSAFLNAIRFFESEGHACLLGENCFADKGIGISNTPEACARELMEAYLREDTGACLSCGGGELMCELLPYLDWERLKQAAPKWYMGYSDNTNFTYLLTTLCDVASVYGPNAPAFGMRPLHPSLRDAFSLLRGEVTKVSGYGTWEKQSKKDAEHPYEPYHTTEPARYVVVSPEGGTHVTMKGRLIGGCMDCLVNLTGTRFDRTKEFVERYQEDGILWFLEACDLNVFGIRRAIWQMKEAGWFAHASGFIIGRPMHYHEGFLGLDQYEAVLGLLRELKVPVVLDADFGHLPPMLPLICGSLATIEATEEMLSVGMELV